jgi:Mn2+/Fe2+ NRAMP family transporter
MSDKFRSFLKAFGPGVLFASTCIGVSHLVQSTRAGADYGFVLLGAVILANIFKFPFFEFASRYTAATGVSIIDGYNRRGKWILIAYLIITIPSMFIVTAAVTFVTAGLLGNLFRIGIATDEWAAILLGTCVIILAIGRYKTLDSLLKIVGAVLLISIIVAFFSAIFHGPVERSVDFIPKNVLAPAGLAFVIALMGWMPTAVDISTWPSLWAEAKIKASGHKPTKKEILLDFNIGYWISAVLAICFLTLGALIIYGSGTELSNSSPVFADQVISMFTSAIGKWSYYIIAVAAFSTMFSTTITVVDGYGRAITRTTKLLFKKKGEKDTRRAFVIWSIVISIGGFLIVSSYLNNLTKLVDLATILSFVIAPLAGFLNYKVIYGSEVGKEFRPSNMMKWLAIAGLIFLSLFTLFYLIMLANPEIVGGWFLK